VFLGTEEPRVPTVRFSVFLPHKSQHGFSSVQTNDFSMTDLKDHSPMTLGRLAPLRKDKRAVENDSRIEGSGQKPPLRIL
jgi:hypothetical protein